MKKKKKGTAIGALMMAGLIVVSVPLGVNRSFSRLREDVEDEYYYDSTGYAIYEGIDTRVAAANNLLTVAEKYAGQGPELEICIDDLKWAALDCENQRFDDIEDVGRTVASNSYMGVAAQNLAEQLEQIELSEKDQKYPAQIIAEMESEQDKIERSSYNDKAREYNARLEKFPANFLRHVSGVKSIGVFGPESDPDPAAEAVETADVTAAASLLEENSTSSRYRTIEEYAESLDKVLASMESQLTAAGLTLKVTGTGNMLTFTYQDINLQYSDQYAFLDTIKTAWDLGTETSQQMADMLSNAVDVKDPVVRIKYISADGKELYSRDFSPQ